MMSILNIKINSSLVMEWQNSFGHERGNLRSTRLALIAHMNDMNCQSFFFEKEFLVTIDQRHVMKQPGLLSLCSKGDVDCVQGSQKIPPLLACGEST